MAHGRRRLRILHLSDLHARASGERERWRRRRVLGSAWDDNLEALSQDGPFDLVCFTGDAAHSGRPDEFDEAAEFLLALLDRLDVSKDRLFVVPGNHDLDRSVEAEAWRAVRDAAWRVEPLDLARWLAGGDAPFGFEAEWRERLFERFAAYRSWVHDSLGLPDPLVGPLVDDGPHAYRRTLDHHGAPVHVVGLDSAWLCGGNDDSGNLRITDEPVMRQLTDSSGAPLDGFRLVLMHHPLEDLADRDRETVRARLAEHADLVLRGHLHSAELSTWADPDRTLRQLAAGCLYEGGRADQYPNACQVLTVDLEDDGAPRWVEVRLRAFSPRGGHWHDDPSLYRDASDGRISWVFAARANRSAVDSPNPFQPYDPVVPPVFRGRAPELRRLEASLEEGNGISLVGDWRIGKSSLLRTWEARLLDAGRTVRFLDGQGPEGESISTFVSAITGRPAPEGTEATADAVDAWARREPDGLAPVLLLDEFDGMVRRFDDRFFERLREMLGRVVVVAASRRPIDQLYEELGRTSPFHNRLRILPLGLIEESATEEIVGLGGDLLDADDREMLLRWAGRHPFHLQLFGHCLAEAKRFGEPRSEALDRYRDGAEARLRDLWHRLDDRDRDALRATRRGKPAIRRSLRRRGLVTEDGEPFGEILASWLREEA